MIRTFTVALVMLALVRVCPAQAPVQELNVVVDPYESPFQGTPEVPVQRTVINGAGQSLMISTEGRVITTMQMDSPNGGNPVVPDQPSPGVMPPESSGGRRGLKARWVPTLPKEYEARDKNGDGQIGMYEWDRSKYAEFMKLDRNGDGFLTPQELNGKGQAFGVKTRRDQEAIPNPGNLLSFNDKLDQTYVVTVTGRTTGSVWGTGTYTTDSDLATAAVHAGVLKDGETGSVHVTIVKSPPQFTGSSANGINSNGWQSFPAAFTVR